MLGSTVPTLMTKRALLFAAVSTVAPSAGRTQHGRHPPLVAHWADSLMLLLSAPSGTDASMKWGDGRRVS